MSEDTKETQTMELEQQELLIQDVRQSLNNPAIKLPNKSNTAILSLDVEKAMGDKFDPEIDAAAIILQFGKTPTEKGRPGVVTIAVRRKLLRATDILELIAMFASFGASSEGMGIVTSPQEDGIVFSASVYVTDELLEFFKISQESFNRALAQ